jgi:hypothetical protein
MGAETGPTILIIRHAEKPLPGVPDMGVNMSGGADRHSLVVKGWQRAGAWAAFFGTPNPPIPYARPSVIIAAKPEAAANDQDDQPSRRPAETIAPLAAKLGLKPHLEWSQDEGAAAAAAALKQSGAVLICWEHKRIFADIVPAIIGGPSLKGLPAKWDAARYDVVLRLEREATTGRWLGQQLLPQLLAGDPSALMPVS